LPHANRLIAGQDKYTAFKNAVLVVGPACVLTHGTAGISFIALQFSDSDLIRKFGEAGLAATIIALLAVLSLVPVFGVLFVRNEKVFAVKFQGADAGVQALRNFCYWIAVRMVSRPGLYSLIALPVRSADWASSTPNSSRATGSPIRCRTSRQAVEASGRLDAKLTGANPIDVLIEFPRAPRCTRRRRCRPSPTFTRWSKSRRALAMSGRWKRCAAGSPRKPEVRMSRR